MRSVPCFRPVTEPVFGIHGCPRVLYVALRFRLIRNDFAPAMAHWWGLRHRCAYRAGAFGFGVRRPCTRLCYGTGADLATHDGDAPILHPMAGCTWTITVWCILQHRSVCSTRLFARDTSVQTGLSFFALTARFSHIRVPIPRDWDHDWLRWGAICLGRARALASEFRASLFFAVLVGVSRWQSPCPIRPRLHVHNGPSITRLSGSALLIGWRDIPAND